MNPTLIDGAQGEGGGQVLRTALALSMATGRPFRIERIRAKRQRPGLLRQHLAAVLASSRICGARTDGAALGSTELEFAPGPTQSGEYVFAIGSAGSSTLVLQAVLPALLTASGLSRVCVEGGTHNRQAPSYDFFATSLRPRLERMGPRIAARLERYGFEAAGGGRLVVEITPTAQLAPIELLERGAIRARRAIARVANLPAEIAERELQRLARELDLSPEDCHAEVLTDVHGPGNVLALEIETDSGTEVVTSYGRRELRSEAVARQVAEEARAFLAAGMPVGVHLADQLLVPMALAGGGAFRTPEPTPHTRTVAEVIRLFLDVDIAMTRESELAWRVEVRRTETR